MFTGAVIFGIMFDGYVALTTTIIQAVVLLKVGNRWVNVPEMSGQGLGTSTVSRTTRRRLFLVLVALVLGIASGLLVPLI